MATTRLFAIAPSRHRHAATLDSKRTAWLKRAPARRIDGAWHLTQHSLLQPNPRVHFARYFRRPGHALRFMDWQGVHVGPQSDRRAIFAITMNQGSYSRFGVIDAERG